MLSSALCPYDMGEKAEFRAWGECKLTNEMWGAEQKVDRRGGATFSDHRWDGWQPHCVRVIV